MSWTLVWQERPWTANAERNTLSQAEKAARTRHWREAFSSLAVQSGIPNLPAITVTAREYRPSARGIPDVGACYGAVKAAIDGLIDAGVIDEDDPRYVKRLTFEVPVLGDPDVPVGLEVTIERWVP